MAAPRCPRCALPLGWCLCSRVPRVASRIPIDVIRHIREADKLSNSVRVAALALPLLRIHDHGAPGRRVDVRALLRPSTALLFPPDPELPAPTAIPAEVGHIVVLDGTWAQARRMLRRLPGLAGLPRLRLPPGDPDRARMRQPHFAGGMATLEAIAVALQLLEGPAVGPPLLELYDELARRGRALRGKQLPPPGVDPTPGAQGPARGDEP